MRPLTRYEAARCAQLLYGPQRGYKNEPWLFYGLTYTMWIDPLYWFGRLWVQLEKTHLGLALFTDSDTPLSVVVCIAEIEGGCSEQKPLPRLQKPVAKHEKPCMAICMAIEFYQAENRRSEVRDLLGLNDRDE